MDEELIGFEDELDEIEGFGIEGSRDLIGDDDDDDDDLNSLLDLVGDDEEDDELDDWLGDGSVGARRSRRRGGSRRARLIRARRAIARKRRRGMIAARRKATSGRQIFFGGNATQGGTAGVLTVSTKVQELCRVTRLFIVGDDGAGTPVALDPITWSVLDIKVGVKSQFTALEAIPGVMFQADNTAQLSGFAMDTVQPGTDFSVQLLDAPANSRYKFAAVAKALR